MGHGQTRSLALKGADGKLYTFRPVLKDPTSHLPAELRETLTRRLLIEQKASAHPAGHVVVPGLLQAAGILHNEPRLVVMPDDPVLGEFREEFKNAVGDIEEWVGSPAFGGTTETIDGEEMWKRLRESPDVRIDSRAYLKARLVDQLLGDWDRDRGQWRWGRLPGKTDWQPIPEDRDEAFARFEGVFTWFLRPQLPLLVRFGPEYSDMAGLTYDSWDLDKRILADLEWRAWDEVAKELQEQLERRRDRARRAAAAPGVPGEGRRADGRGPEEPARRPSRPGEALLRLHQREGRRVLHRRARARGSPASRRRRSGAERAPCIRRGRAGRRAVLPPPLRAGRHRRGAGVPPRRQRQGARHRRRAAAERSCASSEATAPTCWTTRREAALASRGPRARTAWPRGPGTRWDRRPYAPPPPNKDADWIPARDFGRVTGPLLQLSYGTDYGALIGASLNTVGYGFRKDPWADKQSLKVVYSTKASGLRGTYLGQFRFENSPFRIGVAALGSGIETGHFFGSGNTTTFEGSQDTYEIEQDRYELETALVYGPSDRLDLSLGPVVRYDSTEPRDNPVLRAEPVYGEGHFTQVGLSARVPLRRDGPPGRCRARACSSRGRPATTRPSADVTQAFGEVHGDARGYLSTPGVKGLTLAVRAGGQKVFGTHPFFESAFIGGKTPFGLFEPGGGSSVRGLPAQRYAGDSSLYGSTELYLPIIKASLLMRGHIGVMGFFDVGRVWLDGESSNVAPRLGGRALLHHARPAQHREPSGRHERRGNGLLSSDCARLLKQCAKASAARLGCDSAPEVETGRRPE